VLLPIGNVDSTVILTFELDDCSTETFVIFRLSGASFHTSCRTGILLPISLSVGARQKLGCKGSVIISSPFWTKLLIAPFNLCIVILKSKPFTTTSEESSSTCSSDISWIDTGRGSCV